MEKRRSNRNLFIVGGLGLATLLALLGINYFTGNKPGGDVPPPEALYEEIQQLESAIMEIELVNDMQTKENEDLGKLLGEKYDQISFLEKQITELERQGKTDAGTISELREKLSKARSELLERYKVEINELVVDNSRLTRNLDSLQLAIEGGDSLARAAGAERDVYKAALEDCKGSGRGNISLAEIKESIPVWTVDNFNFISVKDGKEIKMQPRIEKKDIGAMRFSFDIKGNTLIKSGPKTLYLVIEDPYKKVYRDAKYQGGTVSIGGREQVYTHKVIDNYAENKTSRISFEYLPTDVSGGKHIFIVYCEGQEVGRSSFIVKL